MSKYIILWGLFLMIFLVFPSVAKAAPSISHIGDANGNLNPNDSSTVTVIGLDSNQIYAWEVKKYTNSYRFPGTDPYTQFTITCFNSNNSGEITQTLGPFRNPGYYRLEIFKGSISNGTCITSGNKQANQDFSVGGSVTNSPDAEQGKDCCSDKRTAPTYDKDRDVCQQIKIFITQETKKTDCATSNPQSFCEPNSIKCFNTKTFVVQGKICLDPNDPNFNKDKNIICSSGGGIGCDNDPNNPAIATAIGCIHTSPAAFVKDFLTFVIGISGGLAFLMMLFGAFQMLTSAGNPETLAAGRSRLTSAVIGLLFVIFAVLLMQIIGFDILKLPGFGR